MLGCFARYAHGSYWVSARVDRSWGYLQVVHINHPICVNADLLGFVWWLSDTHINLVDVPVVPKPPASERENPLEQSFTQPGITFIRNY